MIGEKEESVGDGIDQPAGNVHATAFIGDVIPDDVKIEVPLGCAPVGH
jgi:hypothetical protein